MEGLLAGGEIEAGREGVCRERSRLAQEPEVA